MVLNESFRYNSRTKSADMLVNAIICATIFVQALVLANDKSYVVKDGGELLDLTNPIEVVVEKQTSNSISLSWRPPRLPKDISVMLFNYKLVLTPLSGSKLKTDGEKQYTLPPTINSKTVSGLVEGSRYAVQLSAVFGDPKLIMNSNEHKELSALKFTVQLNPSNFQRDVFIGDDDGIPDDEPDCNCSENGMIACTRRPGFVQCTCQPGYTGKWCEDCSQGYFLVGKECKVCACTNTTSSSKCIIDEMSEKVRCTECLPGHYGRLCTSCTAGFHWIEDKCTALNCLSSSLCAEQRDAPGCEHCIFTEDQFPAPAQRSNSDRRLTDGILPLIAVIVTLGILLLAAGMATCYHYWAYRRHQPRAAFFNVELQDDKLESQSHCQYQHLDTTANRTTNDTQLESSCNCSTNKNERLTTEQNPRSYNTINA